MSCNAHKKKLSEELKDKLKKKSDGGEETCECSDGKFPVKKKLEEVCSKNKRM